MGTTCHSCGRSARPSWREREMNVEFSGIERRLDELSERLARLAPLSIRPLADFHADPYLRDVVERNLEVAAQCCLDICHRIITLEGAPKPRDYRDAILRMGELGVLPADLTERLAPLAGFRNILVHEYLAVDWDEVYGNLVDLDDLGRFAALVRTWLRKRDPDGTAEPLR
jgi:uncharacterized protein YutE (UPF0331/DUF86 family)